MKKVSILGSTGSIGLNTLDVISSLKDNYSLFGISCKTNTLLLHQQIIKYNPKVAVITDSEKYHEFTKKHGKKIQETKILFNSDGLDEISSSNDVDIVVASIVGFECLKPVIKAIKNDKTVMIANKEILVSAGEMLMSFLRKSQAKLLPVDSEHNALLQIFLSSGLEYNLSNQSYYKSRIKNITITASGGPFIDYKISDFKKITSADAIQHPTWTMGKKISVDSSTMMNKGLEIIEAKVLFNLELQNINAIIHRQSKVHALVEFFDGTTIAHMSHPDMRIPISYALTFPQRLYVSSENNFEYKDISFEEISHERYPCYSLAREVAKIGKNSGLILNAANEISVEYFLRDKIMYTDIPKIIREIIDTSEIVRNDSVESILDNDFQVRNLTRELIQEKYGINK